MIKSKATEFDAEQKRTKDTTAELRHELRVLTSRIMEQPGDSRSIVRGAISGDFQGAQVSG